MTEVRFGQNSAVFQRKEMPHLSSLSFSILYKTNNGTNDGTETLDLIAKHPDDFFVWTVGIKHAIQNGIVQNGIVQNGIQNDIYQDGIGASDLDASAASAFERAEEEADLELVAEMEDYEITEDDHGTDHGTVDDDSHEEEDDRLITTGNVMYSWGFNGWGQLGLVEAYAGGDARDARDAKVLVPAQVSGFVCKMVDHGMDGMDGDKTKPGDKTKLNKVNSFDIQFVCCGGNFTVAVDTRMKAYIWGHGSVCCGKNHVLQPSPVREPFNNIPVLLAAAGEQHVIFLSQGGDVYGCGVNDCGQLGLGHREDVVVVQQPVRVEFGGENNENNVSVQIKGVACGHSNSAAITCDGKVYTWGCGMYGALGQGDDGDENKLSPGVVDLEQFGTLEGTLEGATEDKTITCKTISCGLYHMAAILCTSNATKVANVTKVVTWGWNGCGQLGLGNFDDKSTPQLVDVLSGGGKVATQIVCGAAHTAAIINLKMGSLKIRGQLWTWGNGVAALANEDASHAEIPRAFHLTKKGHERVEVFGIAAGDNFTLVLDDEGNLTIVGVNPVLSTTTVVTTNLDISKVDPTCARIAGVDGLVTQIAAGGRHVAVLAPKRFAYESLFEYGK